MSIDTVILQKVGKYTELDASIKKLETEKKPLNADIKDFMRGNGLKEIQVGNAKVVFGKQERVSMNEDKLMERVRELGLTSVIKTVEVVDHDALQEMIYAGALSAAQIEDCIERKEVETLSVKGAK